jgi:hypothetical protein
MKTKWTTYKTGFVDSRALTALGRCTGKLAYFYCDWSVEEVDLELFASKKKSKEESWAC